MKETASEEKSDKDEMKQEEQNKVNNKWKNS
jgi:hypothetical protein